MKFTIHHGCIPADEWEPPEDTLIHTAQHVYQHEHIQKCGKIHAYVDESLTGRWSVWMTKNGQTWYYRTGWVYAIDPSVEVKKVASWPGDRRWSVRGAIPKNKYTFLGHYQWRWGRLWFLTADNQSGVPFQETGVGSTIGWGITIIIHS